MFLKINTFYFYCIDRVHQKILDLLVGRIRVVTHCNYKMKFYTPNPVCKFRIRTFDTKEPDTLTWIESMPKNSILWDVGANIGLYSIYAAKASKCRVFSFEPSVFNLELLAKNVYLNRLEKEICILPIALSDKIGLSLFRMTSTVWGGALSTFGEEYDQHGNDLNSSFEYTMPGIKIDDVTEFMKIPGPDYLKIDVDGIEHLILSGAQNALLSVKSVLIEINDDFTEQAKKCEYYLLGAGLKLKSKFFLDTGKQYNQLWIR
jgi:FkbM family methyltransferase